MRSSALVAEAFGRIGPIVHDVVEGLERGDLTYRYDPEANSIAWLVWHLARVQDDHVAAAAGTEQVWTSEKWSARFGLTFDDADIGYGHSAAQVAAVAPEDPSLLTGYYDAVAARTLEYVRGLDDDDLDRIVDRNWDPPVTLGVRLVSVIDDDLQHAGQAAYLKGLIRRGS